MLDTRDPYEILQVHTKAVPEVIEAAYRALARLHHPDRNADAGADEAMADVNWAYDILREPALRTAYDGRHVPIAVEEPPEPVSASLSERVAVAAEAAMEREASNGANTVLDFGRYAGMSLRQIARVEPGYLEWLRRHSSGLRYRHQIDEVLGGKSAVRASAE